MMNKKKLLALMLALVLLMTQLPLGAFAQEGACTTPEVCLDGPHQEGCALYIQPAPATCTGDADCTLTEGHSEGCPKAPKPVEDTPTCTGDDSCTLTEGHSEGCPKAPKAEDDSPICTGDESCALTEGHSEGCPKAPKAEDVTSTCTGDESCTLTQGHNENCPKAGEQVVPPPRSLAPEL